ncbi:hypothetical protein AO240_24045 [Pseudomonas sp. ICMP 460]|nr:hypothetical protein AO240_24045 [Pseudomonas sp. ICMP 460]
MYAVTIELTQVFIYTGATTTSIIPTSRKNVITPSAHWFIRSIIPGSTLLSCMGSAMRTRKIFTLQMRQEW